MNLQYFIIFGTKLQKATNETVLTL